MGMYVSGKTIFTKARGRPDLTHGPQFVNFFSLLTRIQLYLGSYLIEPKQVTV